jgi:hypothetical protein
MKNGLGLVNKMNMKPEMINESPNSVVPSHHSKIDHANEY